MRLPTALVAMVLLVAPLTTGQCGPTPFTETFNTAPVGGLPANWTTAPFGFFSNLVWTAGTGATPTQNTGPSVDCSVPGGNYMFVNTATGSSLMGAILTSPCFDTSGLTSPTLSFCYHMWYGGQTGVGGNFQAMISVDQGVSWQGVWSASGDQGNQWHSISVTVPAVPDLRVRFSMIIGGGVGSLYDTAIDDLTIGNATNPEWQVNTPSATMSVEGAGVVDPLGGSFAASSGFVGRASTLDVSSTLTGNPWDIIITTNPDPDPIPTSAGGFVTPDGEIVHISVASPTATYFNGGLTPDLATTSFSNLTVPFTLASPMTLNAQMGVVNPSQTSGLSFSQAQQHVTTDFQVTTFIGDDTALTIGLVSPISFYGTSYTQVSVCTNGYIQMGGSSSCPWQAQTSSSSSQFLTGSLGGPNNPVIGVLWTDLNMTSLGAQVVVTSDAYGSLSVEWQNGVYWAGGWFGTIACTVVSAPGPGVTVTLDYTSYGGNNPPEGIVGITSAIPGSPVAAWDFVDVLTNPNAVVPLPNTNQPILNIFQNFSGLGFPLPGENFDLGGEILTFDDPVGTGQFSVF